MRHLTGLALALAFGAGLVLPASAQDHAPASLPSLDRPAEVLFWPQAAREAGFRAMDRIVPHRTVEAGGTARPLAQGTPLDLDVTAYMEAERTAAIIVLKDGQLRFERYGLGFGPEGRWTSFSVAKSVASTLVGAAIRDGHIESLETPITRYLPELEGSAYDGVTVRQLLTMASGADWNEDYTDPASDVARFYEPHETGGMDPTLHYMRQLKRAHAPGTRWNYSTGESNLVGVLLTRATGQTLADYLSRKIWQPYGMAQDAAWMIDKAGQESSGCCLMASARDWARFGQFILEGGVIQDQAVLPDGWLQAATTRQARIGVPGEGYGFMWWTRDDGRFGAHGIFGQSISLDPQRGTVVVILSAWPHATGPTHSAARQQLLDRIHAALAAAD